MPESPSAHRDLPVELVPGVEFGAMKAAWQGRMTQTVARYGEHAPMAMTCCNACRTCIQTNLIAGALAAAVTVGAGIVSLGRRVFRVA
jgi:hypothetical protein